MAQLSTPCCLACKHTDQSNSNLAISTLLHSEGTHHGTHTTQLVSRRLRSCSRTSSQHQALSRGPTGARLHIASVAQQHAAAFIAQKQLLPHSSVHHTAPPHNSNFTAQQHAAAQQHVAAQQHAALCTCCRIILHNQAQTAVTLAPHAACRAATEAPELLGRPTAQPN